jgi:hypothetical protein
MASSDNTAPKFRLPTHLADSSSAPEPTSATDLQAFIEGDWFLIKSSNTFWSDKKNVRQNYTKTASYIENTASYQPKSSDAIKSLNGKDTPSASAPGSFTWQGKGLARLASLHWEVLSATSRPEGADWMLAYVQKSMFSAAAINILCRERDGVSEGDMKCIGEWLAGVKDEKFQQTVAGLVDIMHEG